MWCAHVQVRRLIGNKKAVQGSAGEAHGEEEEEKFEIGADELARWLADAVQVWISLGRLLAW